MTRGGGASMGNWLVAEEVVERRASKNKHISPTL
jgi:hypothetical protein